MLLDVSAKESMRTRTWPSASGARASRCAWCASWSLRTRRVVVVIARTLNETARRFNTGGPHR